MLLSAFNRFAVVLLPLFSPNNPSRDECTPRAGRFLLITWYAIKHSSTLNRRVFLLESTASKPISSAEFSKKFHPRDVSPIAGGYLEFDSRKRAASISRTPLRNHLLQFQSESHYTIRRASFRSDESISRVYARHSRKFPRVLSWKQRVPLYRYRG